jgi:hypothetical protein
LQHHLLPYGSYTVVWKEHLYLSILCNSLHAVCVCVWYCLIVFWIQVFFPQILSPFQKLRKTLYWTCSVWVPQSVIIYVYIYMVWVNTYRYWYIFSGMNIHLPAILGFTRYQGFDPSPGSTSSTYRTSMTLEVAVLEDRLQSFRGALQETWSSDAADGASKPMARMYHRRQVGPAGPGRW